MTGSHSKAGKRVERIRASDDPHEKYQRSHPFVAGRLTPGLPILTTTEKGNIIDKEVTREIVTCPDCDIVVYYDHEEEPVCSECGLLCGGKQGDPREWTVHDAKAAGRIDGDDL